VTLSFVHDTLAQRVLFGRGQGREHLASEVQRLQGRRVMLIASERELSVADRLAGDLPVAVRWTEVHQHVPVEVVQRARAAAAAADVDVLVPVGGGSTTGLAKAIALASGVPIVAVPTTYAGSEATNVWGMTEESTKTTGVDPSVLPVAVVYDSELTMSLPVELSVASGLNALAHCVDSLWAPRADPINLAISLEGARALGRGLPAVAADPTDVGGRDECLYGAYLAGVGFASAGSGLHHKICHVLGGAFNLPHAQTHAIVLPHVLALNAPAVPVEAGRLAEALGWSGTATREAPAAAIEALTQLGKDLDAPRALRDHGLHEKDLPDAVQRILPVVPESNPVRVTTENLTALLHGAWSGATPRSYA
jgi:alcohol dehydrogenase class IV